MRRAILFLFLVVASLSATVACGTAVNQGTVVAKDYDDPDTWTVSVDDYAYLPHPYVRTVYNYSSACNCQVSTTQSGVEMQYTWVGSHRERRYDGPHWKVQIESKPDSDGKTHKAWKTVSEQEYNHYEIGSWYGQPQDGGDF